MIIKKNKPEKNKFIFLKLILLQKSNVKKKNATIIPHKDKLKKMVNKEKRKIVSIFFSFRYFIDKKINIVSA